MSYLVVDCGTSACKAAVVSESGQILALSRRPIRVLRPAPRSAEVEPEALWGQVAAAARAALRKAGGAGRRIEAVGVSAMLGTVFLGRGGRPLAPALIWMDNRAAAEAEEIRRRIPEALLYAKTGRRVSPELLAPRLMWLAKHRPAIHRRTRAVIGLKDEIVRRLTGAVQTDSTHLDYSLLFNIRARRLDGDVLAELGIDGDLFPIPRLATDMAGALTPQAASALGLAAGLPVISGSSDGTTAMYGGGVLLDGAAVLVTGSTEVLMAAVDRPVEDPSCTLTVNTALSPGRFLAGGAMGLAGGALQHFQGLLGASVPALERRMRRLPPGCEGLLVFPGLEGERAPYWMAHVTGGMAGLGLRHRPEHVLRAAMEGAAFRTGRLLSLMRGFGLPVARVHVTGGYAGIGLWNQIRADIFGVEVVCAGAPEATALGTAMFCRAAMDGSLSLSDIARRWLTFGRRFRPHAARHAAYRALAGIFDDFIQATAESYRRLASVAHVP
jgi:sugar (pentulose or hexulose) kinase